AAAEGVATFEKASEVLAGSPEPHQSPPGFAPGGPIVVSRVTVGYPGRGTPALDGFSTVIGERGVTVLAGPSGCGKSTLLAAMAGLVGLESGEIRVRERRAEGSLWRSQIAWLPQRPIFVAGTVADNLRLAAPRASDGQLWTALRRVALEERVRALPAGLDAAVGEDGQNFSAGEGARLALARVVVAERPWVFLDEPTAHLDELTEQVIADTIVELGTVSGVVVVAHTDALLKLGNVVRLPAARACAPGAVAANVHAQVGVMEGPPAFGRRAAHPFALSTVVGALAAASGVALTATAGWLIVQAAQHPPILTLLVAIVGVRTFGLARPVLRYVERVRSHDEALGLLAERRVQVYDAVVPLTPGGLGRRRGDVLAAVVDDVDSVLDRELRVRMPVRSALLVAVMGALAAAALVPVAGVLVAATVVAGTGLGFVIARLAGGRAEARAVTARAELSARVVETMQVAPELVMWQAETRATDRVVAASRVLTGAGSRAAYSVAGARSVVLTATGVGVAAMGLLTAPLVADGTLSRPMLALLVLLPLALADVAVPVVDAGALAARTRAAELRLHALETTAPAVRDPVSPVPARPSTRLVATRLSASWGDTPVLAGLALDLKPGQRIGVVGPSGSGKSTLAALLLRFIDPTAGEVRLGGVALPELALDDVRRTVGLVDDDPHVFATTLRENVRLARPSAADADLVCVLRRAQLGPWLDDLPDGLQTWLGDGHSQVSGGERARIGLARCLLADAPVLVLDEPTAHLDSVTAAEVSRDVLDAADGRSVVWITHGTAGLDRMSQVIDLGAPGGAAPVR
ncbi:MAG: thiol reductant ABC exporter subunit CydC, partial [Marmoricola sp.]